MSIVSLPPQLRTGETVVETYPYVLPSPYRSLETDSTLSDSATTIAHGLARIGGATIRYTLEKPGKSRDPIPIVIAPGYVGVKSAYKELRHAIAARGKPAVTFRPPRNQKQFAGLHPKHLPHPERLLAQAVLAVSNDVLKSEGNMAHYGQVDAAGHSMGGPAVTNAALVRPDLFRSVTLMASSGLDGHTIWDMAERTPDIFAHEMLPLLMNGSVCRKTRAFMDVVEYVACNPWRTLAEGLAASCSDIRVKVSQVGALGVYTAAQQYAQDKYFPLEGVQRHSKDRFDVFHIFPDPEAGHMAPQIYPESVAQDLINILAALKAQHS